DSGFLSQSSETLHSMSKIRISDKPEMFVDKYKPTSSKEIIGQTGDRSNVAKLTKWLRSWHDNRRDSSKTSKKKSFHSEDDGSSFKAVLLSGPPGIGKTTAAQLVCRESGFVVKELNASDARSKKTLGDEVACLLENKVLDGYFVKNDILNENVKNADTK